MEKTRAHVLISGRVQGVCFRMETERQATEHNLTGWVRNLPDGRVEAVFEGKKKEVEEVVAWSRRGPSAARISDLHVEWKSYRGDFLDFRII